MYASEYIYWERHVKMNPSQQFPPLFLSQFTHSFSFTHSEDYICNVGNRERGYRAGVGK